MPPTLSSRSCSPPSPTGEPTSTEIHGQTRTDDYEWLRDKDDPEVTAYLEAENAYTQERTAHLADLRQAIFDEIKARTLETDLSVPTRNRGYWYYGRSFEGKEYGASCRVPVTDPDDWTPPRPAEDTAPDQPALPGEQVLLDLNALAEGHEFFSLGGSAISPDDDAARLLDRHRRRRALHDPGQGPRRPASCSPDEIAGVIGGATWDRDGENFYYTTVDDAWRADKIWRHRLGTAQADDELVHHETDGRFWVGVGRTRSDRFLVIAAGSKTTSEYRFLDADAPEDGLQVFAERARGPGVLPRPRRHRAARTSSWCCTTPPAPTSSSAPRPIAPTARRASGGRWSPTTPPSASRTSTPSPATSWSTSAARGSPSCASSSSGDDRGVGRRLPRRVRPRGLHGRLRRQPRASTSRSVRLGYTTMAVPVVGLRLRRPRPAS